MDGALAGIRVIDATQMLAGPIAGKTLGDLGADVIKVESPESGEYNRTHGFEGKVSNGEMTTFLAVNRSKRSLALDLKSDAGRETLFDLVRESDVFTQNFRRGTAERLGIGYEQLSAINPKLIYCSISGYGVTGPYRDRPGQDLVLQGYSGSMFSVGSATDDPIPSALWAADVMTGYQADIGILAALQARARTGRGQHVQIDMLSVVMDSQLQEIVTYLNTGRMPERTAERGGHASIPAPYGVYRTKDAWLTLAMMPPNVLGEVLDDDWLRSLTRYDDGDNHRDEIYARIRQAFVGKTTAEWIEICDSVGAWCGPVYNYEELFKDPHIVSEGYVVEQSQYRDGSAKTIRPPIKLSDTPAVISMGAPALGEHSREILASVLNYDAAKIDQLISAGAVGSIEQAHDAVGAKEKV